MVDEIAIKTEIVDAKEDLRDALHEINNRVEERVAKMRPDRGIRKHPMTTACVAGALGFALGSDSSEAATIALLALGATFLFSRETSPDDSGESNVDDSSEIERI
jgi:hypothetical protein